MTLYIIRKKNNYFVFLNNKIFFVQEIFFIKNIKNLRKFWFFFILKILYHFGLFKFDKNDKYIKLKNINLKH